MDMAVRNGAPIIDLNDNNGADFSKGFYLRFMSLALAGSEILCVLQQV